MLEKGDRFFSKSSTPRIEEWGKVIEIDKREGLNLQAHLEKLEVWRSGLMDIIAKHKAQRQEIKEKVNALPSPPDIDELYRLLLSSENLEAEVERVAKEISSINNEITKIVIDMHDERQELFGSASGHAH